MSPWTALIGMLVLLAGAWLLVPASVFSAELLLAGASRARGRQSHALRRPGNPVAVIMPAHNERANIERSVQAIKAQLREGDRLLVVADNCQDNTAELARAAGAEVTIRVHDTLRGKGYALDHGIRHLSQSTPPEVVIMVDSDSILHAGGVAALQSACLEHGGPVQATYLMQAPEGAGIKTRVAAFAWLIKNHVRPLGARALGWPCHLTGSGMAFPWSLISTAPLASGHLVEDMQLGIDLALKGQATAYCEHALVTSEFPLNAEGQDSQRTRWEHGHLGMILSQVPQLLKRALAQRDVRLLGLALDLAIPPLTSLVLLLGLWCMACALAAWVLDWASLAVLPGVSLALMAGALTLTWWRQGQEVLPARDLWAAPLYVLGKLPIYVRFLTRRQLHWIRTRRDDESQR